MNNNEKIKTLLSRHKLNGKIEEKISNWIELFKSKVENLSELSPVKLDDHTILENVKFPLDDHRFKVDTYFWFNPPKVHVVGSYALQCLSRTNNNNFEIDLALEIPRSCWQQRDHLNFIYHRKRALYLAYIAKQLISYTDIIESVEYKYFKGNTLKPILLIKPFGKLGSFCSFNLLAFPSLDKSFVFKKFAPSKCNIRNELFDQNTNLEASPIYNSSIQSDLTLKYFADNLKDVIVSNNVPDALILIRIWLERSDLRNSFSYILTAYTYYLIKNNLINANLSALQIFKSILSHINSSLWDTSGIVMNVDENSMQIDEDELNNEFLKYFPVCLIESSSQFNLCSNVSIDLYERLKLDASRTLNLLNDSSFNIIDIFATNLNFNVYFDYLLNISTDQIKENHIKDKKVFIDNGFNLIEALIPELIKWIKNAVSDRIDLIQHRQEPLIDAWDITNEPPKISSKFITFGLIIKNDSAFDVITKGPHANKPEAVEFRNLWGEKSEIRRFQNGDICEAVFWNCDTFQKRRNIVVEAIKYILNRKFHLKLNCITSTFGYLDGLLEMKNIKFDNDKFFYGTGEQCLAMINQNMNILKKYLHNMNNLPFRIIDVVGVDASFRSTDVFPSFPINSQFKNSIYMCNTFDIENLDDKIKHVNPTKIIVKIDYDFKSINDLEALENQKYLHYYELGKALTKVYNLIARVTTTHLDVFFNGYVFRLIFSIDKEIAIHRQASNKNKMVKVVDSAQADEIEFKTQVLPAIASCLNRIDKENTSYSITCRLFKRWISLQMIKHMFNEITLDLLVAYSYLYYNQSSPTPNSPISGLLRVLTFIAEFDFAQQPLIFNFNNILTSERIENIKQNFVSERSKLPIIFIVTPYDRKLSYHTRFTPDILVVYHLKKLALAAQKDLTSSIKLFKTPDIKSVFSSSSKLSIFDIVIKLKTKMLVNKFQALDFPNNILIKQSLYSDECKHSMPIVDYDPARIYLNCLKKSFKNIALFFYDEYGGKEIGVLLRPDTLNPKPFKSSSIEASILTNTSFSHSLDNVTLNIEALKEDFQILGDGLVDTVIVKSDKLIKNFA